MTSPKPEDLLVGNWPAVFAGHLGSVLASLGRGRYSKTIEIIARYLGLIGPAFDLGASVHSLH
jgi:hypothetical protein